MSETLEVVGIEFDTTSFEDAARSAEQQIAELEKAVNESAAAAERAGASYEVSADAIMKYAQAQRLTADEVAAASEEYDKLFGSTEDLNDVHAEAIRWNQHYDQVVRAQTKAVEEAHTEALRMNAAFDAQNVAVATGVTGLGRINSTLASMARQAAGVHPVLGQVTNTLSTVALGAGTTTAVLAGIAAIGFAWRKLTEDERAAREETERTIAALDDLVAKSGPGELPGQVRGSEQRLAELQEEMAGLRQRIAFNRERGFDATADRLQKELNEVALRSAAERERLRAAVSANAEVLPEVSVDVPRTDRAAARARERRHDLAVKNLQADLAEIDRLEQEAAAAALEHDEAVAKVTQQLELEHIALTQGEVAAFRASLAMQGWTEAEIAAAESAFRTNQALREQQEAADKLAQEELRALEDQARQVERAMRHMSDVVTDSFFAVIDGTESVLDAFENMVQGILRELARNELQGAIGGLLGGLFSGGAAAFSPEEVGAAIDVSNQITPTFGLTAGARAPTEIHYQTVNLSLNAIDGRDAARFLEANRGVIAGLVRQTANESSRF